MNLALLYTTALLLGSAHAFEIDHLAAVTTFAIRRPRIDAAIGFAVRWAIGHGAAVVGVGAILLLIQRNFPAGGALWLERAVGVMLVLLGVWTLRGARRLHVHEHRHENGTVHVHLHSHARSEDHAHRHGITGVGLLHGLSGTGPVVALVPVTTFDSAPLGIGYLLLFALGTILGMALYGMIAGYLVGRLAIVSQRLARAAAFVTGIVTLTVGFIWMLR